MGAEPWCRIHASYWLVFQASRGRRGGQAQSWGEEEGEEEKEEELEEKEQEEK